MKRKELITGIIIGSMITGTGVLAAQYTAAENPFPIQLNGQDVYMQGYNINDETYFRLRDIADVVGGFGVDFNNNTIQLSKDGYVYSDSAPAAALTVDEANAIVIDHMHNNGFEGIDILPHLSGEDDFYFYYDTVMWYNDGSMMPGYRLIMDISMVYVDKYTGEITVMTY